MKKVFKNPIIYIALAAALIVTGGALYFSKRVNAEEYYIVNNQKYEGALPDFSGDVHKVSFADGKTSYTNYPMAYNVTFPGKAEFDVSHAKIQTKGSIPEKDITFAITKEYSPSLKYPPNLHSPRLRCHIPSLYSASTHCGCICN